MKEFNLEEAKQGKPVWTRDGRKVRIICWDCKEESEYPILALAEHEDREFLIYCTNDGRYDLTGVENPYDLMMVGEKKEGWVSIYKEDSKYVFGNLHTSRESAEIEKDYYPDWKYITTIKIEWEE